MNAPGCAVIRPALGPFADGELRGPSVLRVLNHVNACAACTEELEQIRQLGDIVRLAALDGDSPAEMAGLASTVISRSRAEAAQSWHAVLRRGCEDWHWALVGAGSVSATFVITLCLSALLAFGPKAQRADSLSALISNLGSSSGCLFIAATLPSTVLPDNSWLVQVDNGCPTATRGLASLALRSEDVAPSDSDVIAALAVVMKHGSLHTLRPADREFVNGLLEAIERRQLNDSYIRESADLLVHDVRFITSTNVSAKGL